MSYHAEHPNATLPNSGGIPSYPVVASRRNSSSLDEPQVALTGDGRDGFPSRAQHEWNVEQYLGEMCKKKRGKALISRSLYDRIIQVALNMGNKKLETAQFRWWVRNTFALQPSPRGHFLLHENRPIAVREQIYDILISSHSACGHGGRDKTNTVVRDDYSWIPKDVVSRFVASCPGCHARQIRDSDYFVWKINGHYPVAPFIRQLSIAAGHAMPQTYHHCGGYEPSLPPGMTKERKSNSGSSSSASKKPAPKSRQRAKPVPSGVVKRSAGAAGTRARAAKGASKSNHSDSRTNSSTSSPDSTEDNEIVGADDDDYVPPGMSSPTLRSYEGRRLDGHHLAPLSIPPVSNLSASDMSALPSSIASASSTLTTASFAEQQQNSYHPYLSYEQIHQPQQVMYDQPFLQYQPEYYQDMSLQMPTMHVGVGGGMGVGNSAGGQFVYGGSEIGMHPGFQAMAMGTGVGARMPFMMQLNGVGFQRFGTDGLQAPGMYASSEMAAHGSGDGFTGMMRQVSSGTASNCSGEGLEALGTISSSEMTPCTSGQSLGVPVHQNKHSEAHEIRGCFNPDQPKSPFAYAHEFAGFDSSRGDGAISSEFQQNTTLPDQVWEHVQWTADTSVSSEMTPDEVLAALVIVYPHPEPYFATENEGSVKSASLARQVSNPLPPSHPDVHTYGDEGLVNGLIRSYTQ